MTITVFGFSGTKEAFNIQRTFWNSKGIYHKDMWTSIKIFKNLVKWIGLYVFHRTADF
jgi:hypothetical protein